jgi:hypothetical protein
MNTKRNPSFKLCEEDADFKLVLSVHNFPPYIAWIIEWRRLGNS